MLVSVLLLAAALSAPGAASASDASVTRTYVQANYALVAAGHANIARSEAAVKGILGQVRRECPKAAVGSPQNEESTQLSNELIGLMVLTGATVDRPAVGAYLRAVSGLHWSSGSINRAVGGYVRMLRTLYNLKKPSICSDIRGWNAGGWKKLPPATAPFAQAFIPNWVSLGVLPAGLARFETPDLRRIARRSAQFESQLIEMEARLVDTWGDIMNELVLNP
jgi:hypothetical protein